MRFAPVQEWIFKYHMQGEDITLPCEIQKANHKTIEEE